MKRILFFQFSLLILLLQGCVKENSSSCRSELLLRFRYTLNDQYVNLFGAKMNRVMIYLFDHDGKYVGEVSEQGDHLTNDYVMRVPLPEGVYQVVAFGGNFSTYTVGDIDNQTNNLSPLLRGVTDIHNFRTELKSGIGEGNYRYPIGIPDDLYAGLAMNVTSSWNNETVRDVELINDTKKIKVRVTGVEGVTLPLEIRITAQNGRYQFDNGIDNNYGVLKYVPNRYEEQPNIVEANLKILRLTLGQSPMLIIKSGQDIIYNENIINLILSTQQYISQEDFDREDEFVFEIGINSDLEVVVSVNGWVINEINPATL